MSGGVSGASSGDDRACAPSGVDVVGYEGLYHVTQDGRIIDVRRDVERKPVRHTDGYWTVRLLKDGCQKRHYIHRLVCQAFHGDPMPGLEVAHLDGDPSNAAASNLAWVTRSENNRMKLTHGTRQSGERNGRAKFSDVTVQRVRELLRGGASTRKVAAEMGISKSHVARISSGVAR